MKNLSTTYLGLKLRNPIVAAASPLSKKLDSVRKLDEAGVGAIVMYSLFEEQISHESLELDHYLTSSTGTTAEAFSYFPETGTYSAGPGNYLDHLTAVKKSVSVPVIGSLNCISKGGWTSYARYMQDAGADAIELNIYYVVTDPALTSEELENSYIELVSEVKSSIKLPLSVKISPFHTALPHFAKRLCEAGADGLVFFNRFYQPDFNLDELEIENKIVLSTSEDLRLPLRWTAILSPQVEADLAITSGIHTGQDMLKAMMAGAKAGMLASELLVKGPGRIPELIAEMEAWMQEHDYDSIQQMQGSLNHKSVKEPAAFERANYMKMLASYKELP